MTELKRYDIDTVRGVFGETLLERDYRDDGDNVDAYEARDVIEALEKRVEELEKENLELKKLRECMDAYLDAQKPKKYAPPVCGTLCTACEETKV
jgi:midasin (ATPase involved in ribosome maturation)